ncbi:hypothetical protein WA026_023150 [Henosepilachna vigintioctopunctata]|uniref:Exoribonuclease phosphorolytic domain-containing protein n=1 Tax=Henosepilachna vigintioctopunctata TaxID=420089 RepID=A0AAW1TTG1_9CUCU
MIESSITTNRMDTSNIFEKELDLRCQFNILTRPNGSVIYCEGETTVIAGIYGPVNCKMSKMLSDKAYIEMNYRPKAGVPSVQDRFYEDIIKNTCETALAGALYPRASVIITVQEMHDDGQLISCAINAACLACLDSGIDMRFIFASISCFLTKDGNLHLETPNSKNDIQAVFVFVFDSVKGDVIVSHTEGVYSIDNYKQGLKISREGSKQVFKFMEQEMARRMKQENTS